jgi:hypothetical protein
MYNVQCRCITKKDRQIEMQTAMGYAGDGL